MKTSWAIYITDSPHQNREQHPTKRGTCGAENEPNDAHGELISCLPGLDAGNELIAPSARKRLSLVESVQVISFHTSLSGARACEPMGHRRRIWTRDSNGG